MGLLHIFYRQYYLALITVLSVIMQSCFGNMKITPGTEQAKMIFGQLLGWGDEFLVQVDMRYLYYVSLRPCFDLDY